MYSLCSLRLSVGCVNTTNRYVGIGWDAPIVTDRCQWSNGPGSLGSATWYVQCVYPGLSVYVCACAGQCIWPLGKGGHGGRGYRCGKRHTG